MANTNNKSKKKTKTEAITWTITVTKTKTKHHCHQVSCEFLLLTHLIRVKTNKNTTTKTT